MASDIPKIARNLLDDLDPALLDSAAAVKSVERALVEAEARGAERMKAEMQTDFVGWLRSWVKKRFGQWITYNTAKGAFNDFAAHQDAIRNLECCDGTGQVIADPAGRSMLSAEQVER